MCSGVLVLAPCELLFVCSGAARAAVRENEE
jgi:hypothetical protein